eukprot:Gb_25253 [translate_table: standard]
MGSAMLSKKNRNQLLVVGAVSAAAIYLAWKTFKSYASDATHQLSEKTSNSTGKDENELRIVENLMKTSQEESGSPSPCKVEDIQANPEQQNDVCVEEFEQFIAEEYRKVLFEVAEEISSPSKDPTAKGARRFADENLEKLAGDLEVSEEILGAALSAPDPSQYSDDVDLSPMENEVQEETLSVTSVYFRASSDNGIADSGLAQRPLKVPLSITEIVLGQIAQQLESSDSSLEGLNLETLVTELTNSLDLEDVMKSSTIPSKGHPGHHQNINSQEATINQNIPELDCGNTVNKQKCKGLSSNGHINELSETGVKGYGQSSRHLLEDVTKTSSGHFGHQNAVDLEKQSDVQIAPHPETDTRSINNSSCIEGLGSECLETRLSSLGNVGFDTLSNNILENVLKYSSSEQSDCQIDKKLKHPTDGHRLNAYDEYLADPSLSPSMKSQVSRVRAIVQKLYEAGGI